MAEHIHTQGSPGMPTIIIQQPGRRLLLMILLFALGFSCMLNLGFILSLADLGTLNEGPTEKHHSGDMLAKEKIARITANFMITNPYTDRLIKIINAARDDQNVKGVLLVIDSPGGLVSDSHEIYHHIQLLAAKKPVYVQMKGIAASGGYYIAMGAGPQAPVFAEPTTWTGSIGVILPRYNATELASKIGVSSDAIATGPLKDTLNPFKDLSEGERHVWEEILEDSFARFLSVIDEGRPKLNLDQIRALATGQVYTANQAVANGLVDEISFEDDTLKKLQEHLGFASVNVIDYEFARTFTETLLGVSTKTPEIHIDPLSKIMEASTPRAMYMFGWQQGTGE